MRTFDIRKTFICIAAILLAAVSCQKDDVLQYNNMTMGNIVDGRFISDQGNIFNVVGQSCEGRLEEQKRAMVICDVLNSTSGSDKEYDVYLKSYAYVLDKDAVALENATEGDITVQDPIHIEQLWVSGGYLNMLIKFHAVEGSGVKHLVNLVYSKDEEGRYVVNFRHNAFGEVLADSTYSSMVMAAGYVCFPIAKFIKEETAKIVLNWKWYKSSDIGYIYNTVTDYTFEYEWARTGFEHSF